MTTTKLFTGLAVFIFTTALIGCSESRPSDIIPKIASTQLCENLLREHDVNHDGKLAPDEVKRIKKVDLYTSDESDLRGLEYLIDIEEAQGNCCKAQHLDLSQNKKLKKVDLMNVKELTDIKVPESLQFLGLIRAKSLTKFKIGDMPFLQWLVLTESPVAELSTGECPSMTTLTLDETNIKHVDLSKFPRLERLYCSNTNINEIDLSMLPNLRSARCKGVKRIIISKDQKIDGINTDPDYKYAVDNDAQIIIK